MYNEEQKTNFIRSYTTSTSTAAIARSVFNGFEKYESEWGADLCTRSVDDIQPVIDKLIGIRSNSRWAMLSVLRAYAKWCMVMRVPNACDSVLRVEVQGVAKMRRQMVANPLHLQKCLDEVFDAESMETIDNIYRCYYWMAYGGIREEDALTMKKSDVDFEDMCIHYRDTEIPIYREALPAFKNVVRLDSFVYINPRFSEAMRMERIDGTELMRGVKSILSLDDIRTVLSRMTAQAIKAGKTTQQLSFRRAALSGLFYRAYEYERMGVAPNFSEAAANFMEGKTYHLKEGESLANRQRAIAQSYMMDYQRWKLAFSEAAHM